jgi:hypothetical protein
MTIRKGCVDEIGKKEAQIEILEAEVKVLKDELKAEMSVGETVTEAEYYAKKGERVNTTYDVKKVKKAINDDKKFINSVSVSSTKVKKYLPLEQLDRCIEETKVTETISVKPIKK